MSFARPTRALAAVAIVGVTVACTDPNGRPIQAAAVGTAVGLGAAAAGASDLAAAAAGLTTAIITGAAISEFIEGECQYRDLNSRRPGDAGIWIQNTKTGAYARCNPTDIKNAEFQKILESSEWEVVQFAPRQQLSNNRRRRGEGPRFQLFN